MILRIISNRDELKKLSPREKFIHFGFRPSTEDLFGLSQRCPRLRMIQMPPSYYRTMSKITQYIFKDRGITICEGDIWGYRRDLHRDFIIDESIIEEIRTGAKNGASIDCISNQIKEKIRISSSLLKYIIDN